MFKDVKKILVVKLRHIGDVLLTVPAIRALKEAFPGASVHALVNAGTEEMLTLNPLLGEVIVYDRSVKGMPAFKKASVEIGFVRALRERRFDMAVDLTGGDRPALLGFLSGARYRLGYEPSGGFAGKKYLYTHLAPRPTVRTHTVLSDLGVLRPFGITTKDLTVDIHTSPQDDAFLDRALKAAGYKNGKIVHVHPTSRWLFKCWTDEGMAGVMDRLSEAGFSAVLTSGPGEKELEKIASIKKLMNTSPIDLSGKLRLKHLASLSKRAEFFLGVDSAPMHIAAATGTRAIGIFGPSGVFDWGPWDNKEKYSGPQNGFDSPYPRKSGVQLWGRNIAIQKDWDCIPCGKDGCNSTKKSDCLDKLNADEVWEELKRFVSPHL